MGLLRRTLESGFGKLEGLAERITAGEDAKLSPAERERVAEWEARAAAARAGTPVEELGDARLVGSVLHGPAGEALHGIADAPQPGAALEDPAAWEEQRRAEHAARDERRAPYLAATRAPVHCLRIATRRGIEDVVAELAASGLAGRPDLVYGAYRVPDRITAGVLGGEAVVEWEIVHAAEAPLAPAGPARALHLDARDPLVARAVGEPAPLDEDVALGLLDRAGIGPEQTLAVARDVGIRHHGGDSDASTPRVVASVRGVHVLVAGGAPAPALDGTPWTLPAGPPAGVCIDVLQWDAIAQAVHPVRQHRAPLPSPYPYLPLTPRELLQAYLEIVGVAPADTYAAQVTHDRPFDLMGRTSASAHVRRTGGGPDLPCADGTPRKRMAGGHHIVVAYRDAPAYVDGRARFEDYATAELHAHLRRGLGLRLPVPKPASRLARVADQVADAVWLLSGEAGFEPDGPGPRYC